MYTRFTWLFVVLVCLCAGGVGAEDLLTTDFVKTPDPTPETLVAPRALVADGATRLCYVLDGGLHRVVSFTFDGQPVKAWDLAKLGMDAAAIATADPLLPQPAMAVAQQCAYLLKVRRGTRRLDVILIDGTGAGRTLTLPEDAENGAVALDNTGHVVAAYLQQDETPPALVIAREGDDGAFSTVTTLKEPCDAPADSVTLTGFTVAPDGRVAVGLAQAGDAQSEFCAQLAGAGDAARQRGEETLRGHAPAHFAAGSARQYQ